MVLGFLFVVDKGGPFFTTFFTAEEIDSFITVEKFKDMVYRK